MRKALYFFVLSLILFTSCEEDLGNVGRNLLPVEDDIAVFADSSTTFSCSFERDDTIRSKMAYSVMLGTAKDEYLGDQTAHVVSRFYYEFYSYLGLLGDGYYFNYDTIIGHIPDSIYSEYDTVYVKSGKKDNPDTTIVGTKHLYNIDSLTIKSVKLTLMPDEYMFGDDSKQQTFTVFELNEDLTVQDYKDYYNNGIAPIDEKTSLYYVGQQTQIVESKKGDDTIGVVPLEIPLTVNFARHLHGYLKNNFEYNIPKTDSEGKNLTLDKQYDLIEDIVDSVNVDFVKDFKGLFIRTDVSDALMHYKNPEITFTYKRGTFDDGNFKATLITDGASFVDEDHAYIFPMTFFENNLKFDADTILDNVSVSYVCGGLGYRTKIDFSNMDRWLENDSAIINQAKLFVPYNTRNDESLLMPETLTLVCNNDKYITGKVDNEDVYYTYSWSGIQNTFTENYEFDISSFFYDFINIYKNSGNTTISDFTFYIVDPSNFNDVDRVILNCGDNSKNLKLRITYTQF